MRKSGHIFVRPIRANEAQMFFDWATENASKSGFDPKVVEQTTTITFAAYDKTGVIAFQPVQQVFMVESLAPRPDEDKFKIAMVLKEFTQAIVTQAHLKGVNEVYYLGTDADTDTMAANHTYEELPYKVFRMRISDLEG